MYKLTPTPCRKCGGETSIHWFNGKKFLETDIGYIEASGMRQRCGTCGYSETIPSLDDEHNKQNAYPPNQVWTKK